MQGGSKRIFLGFNRKNDTYLTRSGFILIELMVVIVILSILAVYMMPKIMGRPEQARRLKARVDIQALETALKLYKLDNGRYPTTDQCLQALVEPPDSAPQPRNWREGGYVEKGRIAKDPWGPALPVPDFTAEMLSAQYRVHINTTKKATGNISAGCPWKIIRRFRSVLSVIML